MISREGAKLAKPPHQASLRGCRSTETSRVQAIWRQWKLASTAAEITLSAGLGFASFCGAFENPPHHVAELFGLVRAEPELSGVFRRVAFAIIDDHNAFRAASPEGNYVPFERALAGCPSARKPHL